MPVVLRGPKSPKNAGRIHRESTSPVSSLKAHFDPRWTTVVDARVAASVLRIGGFNVASTTGNNVGTSSSFISKRFLHQDNPSLVRIAVERILEVTKTGCASAA